LDVNEFSVFIAAAAAASVYFLLLWGDDPALRLREFASVLGGWYDRPLLLELWWWCVDVDVNVDG
jgi:hypothetical protein